MAVPRSFIFLAAGMVAAVFAASLQAARVVDTWEAEWAASDQLRLAQRDADLARITAERAAATSARETHARQMLVARAAALEAVKSRAKETDLTRSRWDPLHFAPAIGEAQDEQCLVCHADVLRRRPLAASPAGVKASDALAWYQTLETYDGEQDTLHRRHLVTPLAKSAMNLTCNFCHQGHDPREAAAVPAGDHPAFTLRKTVNPSETCLLCHGRFPVEVMAGLQGPWHEVRADLEDGTDVKNGCLTCHETIRSARHRVSYLNAEAIETAAKEGSDTCYGCHGGRAWYRISYPYPRNAWPDMDPDVPEWAKDRPTRSDPRYRLGERP